MALEWLTAREAFKAIFKNDLVEYDMNSSVIR